LIEVTLELGAELLVLAQRESSHTVALQRLAKAVTSGAGFEKFREMVAAQGGDLDAPRPVAPASEVAAPRAGYVTTMDTEALGRAIIELGGGRKKLGDSLDRSTGLEMLVRLGDQVGAGQPLVRVFAQRDAAERVQHEIASAIAIGDEQPLLSDLIAERISDDRTGA
jgi:thymidine phosphorylase